MLLNCIRREEIVVSPPGSGRNINTGHGVMVQGNQEKKVRVNLEEQVHQSRGVEG